MDKLLKRRIATLLLMFVMTLGTAMRSTGFENVRTVEVLLLLSSGMCLGVALSLFMQHRRAGAGTQL